MSHRPSGARAHALLPALLLSCLGFSASPSASQAQSLIVGIPSAETTPRGRLGLTHESQALVFRGPAAWNSFSFVTYGVNDHLEASVLLSGLSAPTSGELSLGAGFKWVIPLFGEGAARWEPRLTVGTTALFSLDRQSIGGWGYAHASVRLPVLRTRLTAGMSYGSEELFGRGHTPVAFLAGIEQPITDWLWLVADWYSGSHSLGALIPAVQFNVDRFAIILGYKLDNDREAPRDALIAEVAVLF